MPSRDELEQDLRIVEAERDAAEQRAHELEKENARLRGERALLDDRAAASLGSDLSTALMITPEAIAERGELEVIRAGIDDDLDALNELRKPSGAQLKPDAPERAIDVVRANQRERAELQHRTATANTLLSRIAAIVKMDRWDEDGGENLLARLQSLAHLHLKLSQQVKHHKKELAAMPADAANTRAYHTAAIAVLEKALAMPLERPAADPTQPRRIVFVVGGHEVACTTKPDDTVAQVRELAITTFYPSGGLPLPIEQWLIVDENGRPLPVDSLMRDIELPSNRIVITTPAGSGG